MSSSSCAGEGRLPDEAVAAFDAGLQSAVEQQRAALEQAKSSARAAEEEMARRINGVSGELVCDGPFCERLRSARFWQGCIAFCPCASQRCIQANAETSVTNAQPLSACHFPVR